MTSHRSDSVLLDRPTIRCDLSRRQFGVAATIAAAGVLAGCSRSTGDAQSGGASRTLSTPMGDVEIPAAPTRVVSLDAYVGLQALDELGAPVVATGTLGGGIRTLVSDRSKQLPSVGVTALGDVQIEAIAAARPDLIVGREPIGRPVYDKLSAIAPTVLVPFSYWRDQYIDVAEAVGLKDGAQAKFIGLDRALNALRTDVARSWPRGVKLSVVRISGTSGFVRSYNTLAASAPFLYADVLSAAGVSPTANTAAGADPKKVNTSISLENLREVDGDVIVYYVGAGGQADASADVEHFLTGNPLWANLSAVQSGRAYKVDSAPWFDGYNLAAAHAVVADLRRVLLR